MESLNEILIIAPCGMNCSICMAYLREKNKCPGCKGTDLKKPVTRVECKIKNCETVKRNETNFCYECKEFPCNNLRHLDKRYRTKYKMSMIENLENIKQMGMRRFLINEKSRWLAPSAEVLFVFIKDIVIIAGTKIRKSRPMLYRLTSG